MGAWTNLFHSCMRILTPIINHNKHFLTTSYSIFEINCSDYYTSLRLSVFDSLAVCCKFRGCYVLVAAREYGEWTCCPLSNIQKYFGIL